MKDFVIVIYKVIYIEKLKIKKDRFVIDFVRVEYFRVDFGMLQ